MEGFTNHLVGHTIPRNSRRCNSQKQASWARVPGLWNSAPDSSKIKLRFPAVTFR